MVVNLIQGNSSKGPLGQTELEVLRKSNRLLMIYQWGSMLQFMRLNFNAANLPTVKIGNFRAVLKETLLTRFSSNLNNNPYSFEIVLNFPNRDKTFFLSSIKTIPFSKVLELDMFIRLKLPKENKCYNDRVTLKKLLEFFPQLQRKVSIEDIKYSDLLHLAREMFTSFHKNYLDADILGRAPSVNALSFFVREALANVSQTHNSGIGRPSEQINANKYPVLLAKKAVSVHPLRMAVIMLPDPDSIEFYLYSLDSNIECSKVVPISDCEAMFPFIKALLPQPGLREEIGERLFAAHKNTLLMELFIKEAQIKNTAKVGARNLKSIHKHTMMRGEKIKL